VWKFGGTSVSTPDRLHAVAERMVAAQRTGRRVVAVLSAMGSTTDELAGLAYQVSSRPPLRELDALLSVGESISCALAAMAVHELGARAVSFTAAQAGIRTDDQHGNARLREVRPGRIVAALNEGAIVLVTGFQGVAADGAVTTLGRGGSDASAVAVAAALGVPECEIFTDVAGLFTADPRVVPGAQRRTVLRHAEMLEMAEAGAGVLQSRSIELAATHGVDIHLRSSFTSDDGTWIRSDRSGLESEGVAGVAHRDRDSLYCARDVSAAVLASAMAARGVAVGAIARRGDEMLFTAPAVDAAEVSAALAGVGTGVAVRDDLGSVSVVSLGIARKPDIAARALAALEHAGIEPLIITTTPGRLSVHVAAPVVGDAVRLLHGVFFPAGDATVGDAAPVDPPAAA
jgi:aspartate kinase